MNYIIKCDQVIEVIKTKRSEIRKHYSFLFKIVAVSEVNISLDEIAHIEFKRHIFDLDKRTFVTDKENADSITILVEGVEHDLIPIEGVATLEFSSSEAGAYKIYSVNQKHDNCEVVITVA